MIVCSYDAGDNSVKMSIPFESNIEEVFEFLMRFMCALGFSNLSIDDVISMYAGEIERRNSMKNFVFVGKSFDGEKVRFEFSDVGEVYPEDNTIYVNGDPVDLSSVKAVSCD